MFEKLYYIAIDFRSIFHKDRSKRIKKSSLLFLYAKLRGKLFLAKTFGVRFRKESFLNFQASFFDYKDFFALWREIFLWENYYFETANQAPFIIDAGSNIGMSVLFFKFLYPRSRILCFEPDANACALLKKNITDNGLKDVEVHNAALGSAEEKIFLYRSVYDLASPGSTVSEDMYRDDKEEKVEVSCLRLSKFMDNTEIDFLKIDVEGSEYDVFHDITEKLNLVKALSIEIHYAYTRKKGGISSILKILEDAGFSYAVTSAQAHHFSFIKDPTMQWSIMLDAQKDTVVHG